MEPQLNITTNNIRLREIDANDLPKMVAWRNENRECFIYQEKITLEGQEAWFKKYQKDANNLMFVMVGGGKIVGQLALYNINRKKKVAEFGRIVVDENYSHQGYATESTRALLSYGFNKLKLEMIHLEVFIYNLFAISLYKKCGFRIADIVEREISTGEKRMLYCMSVTKKEKK